MCWQGTGYCVSAVPAAEVSSRRCLHMHQGGRHATSMRVRAGRPACPAPVRHTQLQSTHKITTVGPTLCHSPFSYTTTERHSFSTPHAANASSAESNVQFTAGPCTHSSMSSPCIPRAGRVTYPGIVRGTTRIGKPAAATVGWQVGGQHVDGRGDRQLNRW